MNETTVKVNEERSMNDARQAVMAFNARVNESYKNIVPYTPVEGRQSINQQQAEYILSTMNYDRQRPVRQSHVSGIIDKMMTGSWLDGHNIHFAKCNGEFFLVNGQHRLAAVMQCGRKSVFAVTVMPAKSMEDVHRIYCTFDRDSRPRTNREVLNSAGFCELYGLEKNAASSLYAASILTEMNFIRETISTNASMRNTDYRLSVARKWAEEGKLFWDAIKPADKSLHKKLETAGIMSVAIATFRYQPRAAELFWRGVSEGANLAKSDPRFVFLRTLRQRNLNSGAQGQGERITAVAWNAFFDGRVIKAIKTSSDSQLILRGTPWGGK